MSFAPYLSFQGNAAEAFATYASIFGGTPQVMTFSDVPDGGPPGLPDAQRGWAIHVSLQTDEDGLLMASDMPPQFGGVPQAGVWVSVTRPDEAAARALYQRLAEAGEETMPFGPTFFAKGFGMCRDRFGTHWMVSVG